MSRTNTNTNNHEDRYRFDEPKTMAEAQERKRILERDVRNIERQLKDREKRDRNGRLLDKKSYLKWRKGARSSEIFKKTEQAYLKDWIVERRRAIQAGELGIFDPNDPREMLLRARLALRGILDGKSPEELEVGKLYDTIDQYLQHAA